MKEFTIKETDAFKFSVAQKKCLSPADLNSIEFIQECKNEKGEVSITSTYRFFMTNSEIQHLLTELSNAD